MRTLTNCENPSSNPLQNASCCIQEAACDSVNYSVSRWWLWSMLWYYFSKSQTVIGWWHFQMLIVVPSSLWDAISIVVKTIERITMTYITGNSDAASSKIYRISTCFHRSKQEFKKYFSWQLRSKQIWKPSAHIQKVLMWILRPSKKLFISWHCPVKDDRRATVKKIELFIILLFVSVCWTITVRR